MLTIYRYGNRKLYMESEARFTNMFELVKLVRSGVPFTVRCHKTNSDITDMVLKSTFNTYVIDSVPAATISRLIQDPNAEVSL